jgi:CRISPR-associated protein Cas2
MRILVSYDVRTSTPAGERRLRRVAQACVDYGQRVQKSVFECVVTASQLEVLRRRLLEELDEKEDNLRLYRLPEGKEGFRECYGRQPDIDFEGPLVV